MEFPAGTAGSAGAVTGSVELPCTLSFTFLYPSLAVSMVSSTTSALPGDTKRFTGVTWGRGEVSKQFCPPCSEFDRWHSA